MNTYPIDWSKPTEGKTDLQTAMDIPFIILEVAFALAGILALFTGHYERSIALFAAAVYFRLQHRL